MRFSSGLSRKWSSQKKKKKRVGNGQTYDRQIKKVSQLLDTQKRLADKAYN